MKFDMHFHIVGRGGDIESFALMTIKRQNVIFNIAST